MERVNIFIEIQSSDETLGSELMKSLTDQLDAANAAFQVGYESPFQFNREYHRFFGEPPLLDITYLRQKADSGRVYGASQFT